VPVWASSLVLMVLLTVTNLFSVKAHPYLTYFTIAAIGVVILSMALVADVRSQLWLGLLSLGVVLAAYFIKSARQRSRGDSGEGGLAVGEGRFARGEDRKRDPAAVPLQ
jgi:L-asparagine transporter-like permease